MKRKRQPETAADILEGIFKRPDLQKKIREYSCIPCWAELVGDEVAKHSKPEKIIRGRTLVIRVENAAWAQELSMSKDSLVEGIRQADPRSLVEDIHFKVGNPADFRGH
ncbi:MAG: DUF721 domain-containing protein [bacterium]|nr:DUF721 domain-containing protein [bacterium]